MEFRILGPLEIHTAAGQVLITRRRERGLLAVLLLELGRTVPVDRLVELLWDGEPPRAADAALRSHVSRLRTMLPTVRIDRQETGYALRTDPDSVDAHLFRRLAGAARAISDPDARSAALARALGLWRGPALDGLVDGRFRLCDGLEQLRLDVLDQRIEADLEAGRHREVISELRDLVVAWPARESFAAHLMLALDRSGSRVEALDVYRERREMLAEEFGVEPGRQLRERHAQILREDPAAPRSYLPHDVADFTGREAELAGLLGVTSAVVAISAIDGMAGVGKTALALHVAHRLKPRYPDGSLFVDLHAHTAGRTPMDPASALAVLLRALDVPAERIPEPLDERAALWRAELSRRRVLVLLDNAASAEQVRLLIPGTPGSLVLVTSRRRLQALAGATVFSVDVLAPAEAVALFCRVLGRDVPADEIVELCGYLPLAIRIAAARLRHRPQWTPARLAERLRAQRLGCLAVGDQGIAAAFRLSYCQLDSEQQRMFRLLGVHPGADVDVYAAAALAQLPADKAELLLEDLLDAHLLLQHSPGRYRFHDLIRDYARAEDSGEERGEAVRRLLDYYLCQADKVAGLLAPGREILGMEPVYDEVDGPEFADQGEAVAWCEREMGNLGAVVELGAAQGYDGHVWATMRSLAAFFLAGGRTEHGVGLHELAVAATRNLGDVQAELFTLVNLSTLHWLHDCYADALAVADQALVIARGLGDLGREALCLTRRGILTQSLGRYAEALHDLGQALAVARAAGNRREEAIALWLSTAALVATGEFERALGEAELALANLRAVSERHLESGVLVEAGVACGRLRRYADALGHFAQAEAIAIEVGDLTVRATVHMQRADVFRASGRLGDALAEIERSFEIFGQLAQPSLHSAAHNIFGAVRRDRGELDSAREHHQRALSIATGIGHRLNEARALDGLARAGAGAELSLRAKELYGELGVPSINW
ncbi:BTAD domain-containing putative transcriptional regulator [Amycolatopsis sp. NPDC059657]|uniref:AfsR/SARP family transcriptional regulator n=1 Tax=Amycolatopsis sp. NPDC059657 TaxID=3346899 RepID=UPI00366BE612